MKFDFKELLRSAEEISSDYQEVVDQLSSTAINWFFCDIDFAEGKRIRNVFASAELMQTITTPVAATTYKKSDHWLGYSRINPEGSVPRNEMIVYHTSSLPMMLTNHRTNFSMNEVERVYDLGQNGGDAIRQMKKEIPLVEVPVNAGKLCYHRSAKRNAIIFVPDDASDIQIMIFPGSHYQQILESKRRTI